ncbi:rubber oxygenase-like isoform X2 [Condylostylus longicornis]|uniref:rubber oxygenase-like isoform X2 n=1 Tax=Condylostylus longicornis TaxID=2530218 RepID=UPI00244DA1AF|nr:rubber oxygenase-like isoform X2 [Condylostylus longicornis]
MPIEIDSKHYVQNLLTKGKDIPVDTEINTDQIELPPWYDEKLFRKGQKYYTHNIFAIFIGMLLGLIAVLSIPTILKILISTKKSSNNKTAYQRYMRTIYHTVYWHWYIFGNGSDKDDIIKIRNTKIFKSLIFVRKTHLISSKYCSTIGNGFISQKDMALTQFGFMGFITLKGKYLGLKHNDETLAGTIHFWRVIGYLLGIKDEFNICTNEWDTTKIRLENIIDEIYKPSLTNINDDFMNMVKPLIEGLWSFNPFLSVDAFLFMTKRLVNCNGYEYFNSDFNNRKMLPLAVDGENNSNNNNNNEENIIKKELYKEMTIWNRFVLWFTLVTLQFIYPLKLFKWYFDFQIYLSLFLITYIPFLAYHRFGFKDSYVRIKL